MVFSAKKLFEYVIVHEQQVDLSKANYTPELSSTAMDEETLRFHVTMDRVIFKKPAEIVTKVLEANGFALNLENVLACLDTLTLGTKISLSEQFQPQPIPVVKNFIPCLQFQMPSKSRVGTLLKKFYDEIEIYELELARLQDGETNKKGEKAQSRAELKKELERVRGENGELQAQVSALTQQLALAVKNQVNAARALESHHIVPPQLRLATVRDINFLDRSIMVRAGRTSITIPMYYLDALPSPGDPCLVNTIDNRVVGAFFYAAKGRPFQMDLADVLFVAEHYCKVRDSERVVHNLAAKNEAESELFATLRRGAKIVLYTIDGVMIRFASVSKRGEARFSRAVQDDIAAFELNSEREKKRAKIAARLPKNTGGQ